jgi:hypothetical protein
MSVCPRVRAVPAGRTAARAAASTHRLLGVGRDERLQAQPHRNVGRVLRGGVGEREQRRRQAILGNHLLVVGVPRVEGEQAPVVGRERRRLGKGVGEHRADRPRRVHSEGEHLGVADRLDFAGQARHLLALRREQHHRRIAADRSAPILRTRCRRRR